MLRVRGAPVTILAGSQSVPNAAASGRRFEISRRSLIGSFLSGVFGWSGFFFFFARWIVGNEVRFLQANLSRCRISMWKLYCVFFSFSRKICICFLFYIFSFFICWLPSRAQLCFPSNQDQQTHLLWTRTPKLFLQTGEQVGRRSTRFWLVSICSWLISISLVSG